MKISPKKVSYLIAFAFFLSVAFFASYLPNNNMLLAQDNPTAGSMGEPTSGSTSGSNVIKLKNPFSKGDNLYQFIQAVVTDILLPIGGVLAVIAIIYSGFKLVTARGNETKLEEAKRAFLYTTIGVAILLGAWAIAQVIENTVTQITN